MLTAFSQPTMWRFGSDDDDDPSARAFAKKGRETFSDTVLLTPGSFFSSLFFIFPSLSSRHLSVPTQC